MSALTDNATGTYRIYWERPFKNEKYVVVTSNNDTSQSVNVPTSPTSVLIESRNSSHVAADTDYIVAIAYGQLADEEGE